MVKLGVLVGSLHIILVVKIVILFSFLIVSIEYGIMWKLYVTPIVSIVLSIFVFIAWLLVT